MKVDICRCHPTECGRKSSCSRYVNNQTGRVHADNMCGPWGDYYIPCNDQEPDE